jgi:CBS domain-containing protein
MICPSCCNQNLPGDDVCRQCKQPLTLFDLPQPENPVERSVMRDQVSTLKQTPPVTIHEGATVGDAVAKMLETNVGALLVVDDKGILVGIFSERDLLKRVVGFVTNYDRQPITEFMTPRPESVSKTDTLNFVLQKMDAGGYRHVPVVQDGKPVSIISARDMLKFLTRMCKEV